MIGDLLQKCVDDALIKLNTEHHKPSAPPEEKITIESLEVYLWLQLVQDGMKERPAWVTVIVYPNDDVPQDALVYDNDTCIWNSNPGSIFFACLDARAMPIGADKSVWDTLAEWW